jgi:hypothetical protein
MLFLHFWTTVEYTSKKYKTDIIRDLDFKELTSRGKPPLRPGLQIGSV